MTDFLAQTAAPTAALQLAPRESITHTIAKLLGAQESQVQAATDLLDGGATVPFVARYRKEATGGLDDIQLRELAYQLEYLRELQTRRAAVIKSVAEQGKLTPALHAAYLQAQTKQELEDLYLPFKQKRRTKGMIARECGIEPLADALWANPTLDPAALAAGYVLPQKTELGDDFTTVAAVLDGVRDILSERMAEDAGLVQALRDWLWADGLLASSLVGERAAAPAYTDGAAPPKPVHHTPEQLKFKDYFEYDEPIGRVPSHRALAVFRGRALNILDAKLALPTPADGSVADPRQPSLAEGRIANHLGWSHQGRAADDLLRKCIAWAWKVKLMLSMERDLFAKLREEAERVAIKVFADNLRDLLLAAPAGPRVVLGLDPGIRTGVKVAVVDATGKLVDTATVFPHEPRRDWDGSLHTLAQLCKKHGVNLIAIGNGTASRETDKLAADLMAQLAKQDEAFATMQRVVVSEAGASVYSASAYASQEMPTVDVSLRGAASIARRLQDPLAELVKIDPKSIGVGQYQHDVNQTALARSLDAVVEDCVNHVGVDVNTASAPLLERVSGLSAGVAGALVRHREAHGAFASRRALKDVPGLGAKTFEQCAGFLRIRGGADPLDESGVHPESYPVVARMLQALGKPMGEVLGKPDLLRTLKPAQFVVPPDLQAAQASPGVGLATINDIVAELEKPGRDPRGQFKVARFNDGVNDIKDLQPGMLLEGTVSNVAQFGAFVDLGVHQDGLVHVSQLSHAFTTDARSVVKTGDIVKVQVVEVDVARKRIALTMKIGAKPAGTGGAQPGARGSFAGHGARGNAGGRSGQGSGGQAGGGQGAAGQGQRAASAGNTAMGSAFEKLLKR